MIDHTKEFWPCQKHDRTLHLLVHMRYWPDSNLSRIRRHLFGAASIAARSNLTSIILKIIEHGMQGHAKRQNHLVGLSRRERDSGVSAGGVEVWALRGVDLCLAEGEMVVLQGASGPGKSALVNILGGLDLSSTGRVFFRDQEMGRASDRQLAVFRRDHVDFVFQFYNLVPSLTARENVALVTEIAHDPMPPQEAQERVGLVHRMDHFPAELSDGEQQRVAIARAIAKRPDVLF